MIRPALSNSLRAAAALLCLAAPVAASETLETYFMSIGPNDLTNSSGARLETFAQQVQQDRANYHRFGRADPADEGDRIFGNRQARASIPALLSAPGGNGGNWSRDSGGRVNFADYLVSVCGRNGRATHMIVTYADGDGHDTCEGYVGAGN